MNIEPKPNTSPGIDGAGSAFGFAAAFVSADAAGAAVSGAADLAAAFGAGLAVGLATVLEVSVAGAAATFFGAALEGVAFFGAAAPTVWGVAADLLFVVTILAFSVWGVGAGAVDFGAADFALAATFTAPGFATGFAFAPVSDAGLAVSAVLAGASSASAGLIGALSATVAGSAASCFGTSTVSGFAAGVATFLTAGDRVPSLPASFATCSAGFALTSGSGFCAAASISDDVITTRLAGASIEDAGAEAVLLSPAAEATFAGAEDFVPDFPEVFCLETAIASTS